ncbi:Modification methylase HaeIII [Corynebacterium pseudopelargi]|uniref:Cytosine-specific methyltransferase n=2 Tax=Corynebacterium pseudopelargi TaxID=2080757 RepID=A0A3G6ISG1_9CORY|nr:Modification methylase HaeIII [Corynebacterium pseudopelargi]
MDLFSGAGGLSLGLETGSQSIKTVAAIEANRDAAATFQLNHREAKVYNQNIEQWEMEDIGVDILAGGPPCQGFSSLGKKSQEDPRNKLWEQYVRVVAETKPTWLIIENVPNFLKSLEFQRMAENLQNDWLGSYELFSTIINAADCGVPQNRKRAIIIGHRRGGMIPLVEELINAEMAKVKRSTLKDVIFDLNYSPNETELGRRTIDLNGATLKGPFCGKELHLNRKYAELSIERFSYIKKNGNRHDIPDHLLPDCWKKHSTGASDVMGRLDWERPSVTIRTEFFKPEKGRYLHPERNRALTLLEAARIQGFPDTYKWVGSKTSIARQIGNAVPVHLAALIGRVIEKCESGDQERF